MLRFFFVDFFILVNASFKARIKLLIIFGFKRIPDAPWNIIIKPSKIVRTVKLQTVIK